jgi:plastocyanin
MTEPTRFDMGAGWRRVAAIVAITWAVWAVALTAIIGEIEPFILIFGLVPVAAWGVTLWKPGKASYTVFGALGLITIILNMPFLVSDLAHPESALGFNIGSVALLAALLQTLVGVRVWVSLSERFAARAWQVAAGLFVVGLAVSIIAAAGLEDDEAVAGDVRIVTEKIEFAPVSMTVESGGALFIENKDPGRHTFTVDSLDLDVELPANTARRVVIAAPPGTYEVHCAVPGHEDMTATLVVTG